MPTATTKRVSKEAYERQKQRAAARQKMISAAGRDLEIPKCADRKRRNRATKSLRAFCETYGKAVFFRGWSQDHLRVISEFERIVVSGGRKALAMPRGSGKSKLGEFSVLWAILTGRRKFIALIGPEGDFSENTLDSIRLELECNELLIADFPEVCKPLIALGGIAQRRVMHKGERIRMEVTAGQIVLPNIKGPACSGVISVSSIGGQLRGMNIKRPDGQSVRPDMVVLDDPQTDDSAKSPAMCDDREKKIRGTIMGLAGPGVRMSAIALCTVIRPNDLADRLLDRNRFPEWQGERTQLLNRMPDRLDLWRQYQTERKEGQKLGDDGAAGNEFYRLNREEMDAGAEHSWPERFNSDELSGIQNAMNIYLENPSGFAAEFQNRPLVDDDGRAFEVETVAQSPAAFRDWLLLPNGESFGQSLDPFQATDFEALDAAFVAMVKREPCDRRRIWLERPTGHAKTYDSAVMVAWAIAFSPRRITGVIAGMDKPAAKRLISTIRGIVSENPRLQERLKVGVMKAENHTTGSQIEVISSDAKSAMSLGEPDFLICDQLATWSDPKRWTAMMAATGNRHSVLLVTSQAGKMAGDSWQWSDREAARESIAWHFSRSCGASWINQEFIDFQRSTMHPKSFGRVYGNEWSTAVDCPLLDSNVINDAVVEGCLWPRGVRPAGVNPRNIHIGVDVGMTRGLTVVTTLEQVGEQCIVREIFVMSRTLFSSQGVEIAKRLRAGAASCHIDQGVVGAQLAQELRIAFPFVKGMTLNGAVQGMLADRMLISFTEGQMKIPNDLGLITDLGSIEDVATSKSGKPVVETAMSLAGHADRFWSLALALHGVPRKKAPAVRAQGVVSRYA